MPKKQTDTTKLFAEKLAKLVKERGVKPATLSDDKGAPLSRSYFYRLIRVAKGEERMSSPTLATMDALLTYLDSSLPEFFETWPRQNPTQLQKHVEQIRKFVELLEVGGITADALKAQIDAAYAVLVKPPKRTA